MYKIYVADMLEVVQDRSQYTEKEEHATRVWLNTLKFIRDFFGHQDIMLSGIFIKRVKSKIRDFIAPRTNSGSFRKESGKFIETLINKIFVTVITDTGSITFTRRLMWNVITKRYHPKEKIQTLNIHDIIISWDQPPPINIYHEPV